MQNLNKGLEKRKGVSLASKMVQRGLRHGGQSCTLEWTYLSHCWDERKNDTIPRETNKWMLRTAAKRGIFSSMSTSSPWANEESNFLHLWAMSDDLPEEWFIEEWRLAKMTRMEFSRKHQRLIKLKSTDEKGKSIQVKKYPIVYSLRIFSCIIAERWSIANVKTDQWPDALLIPSELL